jgi:hypothetical protein
MVRVTSGPGLTGPFDIRKPPAGAEPVDAADCARNHAQEARTRTMPVPAP